MKDVYRGVAPEDLPAYPVSLVAKYLHLPETTVRAWVRGTTYSRRGAPVRFQPVIRPASRSFLSLRNLFELLVLKAITRGEEISLQKVRIAVEVLQREFGTEHPLSDIQLLSDRTDVLVEKAGGILNASRSAQWEMKENIRNVIRRIEITNDGRVRFRPYDDGVMDPAVQFGRLCIAGTRIPTEDVYFRAQAGEPVSAISQDLDCPEARIRKAVAFEDSIRKAA